MKPKRPLVPGTLGDEVQKIDGVLVEGSDLAVALIATSFLDECLRSLLAARLREGDTSGALLKSGSGVLGTFSARTDLAYALACIDKHALKALRGVGQIRNAFAHAYTEGSFEQEEIANLCATLDYPYELHLNRWSQPNEKEAIRADLDKFCGQMRNRFSYTCVLLGQTLIDAAQDSKRAGA